MVLCRVQLPLTTFLFTTPKDSLMPPDDIGGIFNVSLIAPKECHYPPMYKSLRDVDTSDC